MTRVSVSEFEKDVGAISDQALNQPVIITNQDRDHLVLLSAKEYNRLNGENFEESRVKSMHERAERHAGTLTELSSR